MEAGMEEGTALFDRFLQADKSEYENRIIFLTDAMPNLGETGDLGLFRMFEDNADQGIYTTFIGIGVDFNTELVESITKIKGANYYSVHSAREFKKRMDDEFDYMVTPLVFDLRLSLDAPGYEIEKVYGSPEADQATGELMKVNTLFPSKAEEGQIKGGVILVKLKKLSSDGSLRLKVSYQDRNGVQDSDEAEVNVGEVNNGEAKADFYQNNGIRKAILLTRYADLLKNWMIDERKAAKSGWKVVPSVTLANGIVIPVELGEWERQSMPLTVSDSYRELFVMFADYFQKEMQAIGDDTLGQEEVILRKLGGLSKERIQEKRIQIYDAVAGQSSATQTFSGSLFFSFLSFSFLLSTFDSFILRLLLLYQNLFQRSSRRMLLDTTPGIAQPEGLLHIWHICAICRH